MSNSEWGPWIEHDGKGCPCIGMVIDFDSRTILGGEDRLYREGCAANAQRMVCLGYNAPRANRITHA